MTDPTTSCEAELLRALNAARGTRQTLEALLADTGIELDEDDAETLAAAKADEEGGMAWLEANAPKCPSCRQAFAFQRQARRPSHCSWCGYDHDTGRPSTLVPA